MKVFRVFLLLMLIASISLSLIINVDAEFSGAILRISLSQTLSEPTRDSFYPAISGNGQFISFFSFADNLVEGDNNISVDLFLLDMKNNTLIKIGNNQGITPPATISHPYESAFSYDGRYIVFHSYANDYGINDTNNNSDIYLFDQVLNTFERISIGSDQIGGNGSASHPDISDDGRYITFYSSANLLTEEPHENGGVYVRDRLFQTTEFIADGNSPSISGDGKFVAFSSYNPNLVPGDTNIATDVFVINRTTRQIERISVNNVGIQGNFQSNDPSISGDGRFVVFISEATNLIPHSHSLMYQDVYIRDRLLGTIDIISVSENGSFGNNSSTNPEISSNGQFVIFQSLSSNLVQNDVNNYCGLNFLENCSDIFIRDLVSDTIYIASITHNGVETNGNSRNPAILGDGRIIVYESDAFNILPGDTNSTSDIYATVFEIPYITFIPIVLK